MSEYKPRAFIDTNILVYAFISNEAEKQEIVFSALGKVDPIISTQVIKEISNVLLRKVKIDVETLKIIIGEICDTADIIDESVDIVILALDVHEKYRLSFYDCLMVAASLISRCDILLSEDMQDGLIVKGYSKDEVKIVNPFKKNV